MSRHDICPLFSLTLFGSPFSGSVWLSLSRRVSLTVASIVQPLTFYRFTPSPSALPYRLVSLGSVIPLRHDSDVFSLTYWFRSQAVVHYFLVSFVFVLFLFLKITRKLVSDEDLYCSCFGI